MNLQRLRASRAGRTAASATTVAALALGIGAASRWATATDKPPPPPTVLSLRPSEVARVAVEAGNQRVVLTRAADGSWAGGFPHTEILMGDIEARLFPLGAYRAVRVDTSAPRYGLVDPEITFHVEDHRGRHRRVLLGGPTFTGGGFYARRATEPGHAYLIPRRMMDDLRSLVAGRRVDAPDNLAGKVRELTEEPNEETKMSGWLQQALDAGTPLPRGLR